MDLIHKINDHYNERRDVQNRHLLTWDWLSGFELSGRGLDLGGASDLTSLISSRVNVENTDFDLDGPWPVGGYDHIFCFGVLECLMNPLHALVEAKKRSNSIFLSYMIRPAFWMNERQFNQLDEERLMTLLDRAGLTIRHRQIVNQWADNRLSLTGIRPILRRLTTKTHLIATG